MLVLALFDLTGVEQLGLIAFDGRCSLDGVPVRHKDGFLMVVFTLDGEEYLIVAVFLLLDWRIVLVVVVIVVLLLLPLLLVVVVVS